jgi:ADP-ribosyl-[dinitrogen reductase] hydrolase
MRWFHLPIADVSIPDQRFEDECKTSGNTLRSMLRDNLDILVHCRGGLGRAGTMAARLLIEIGMDPKKAITSVRMARPDAIEIRAQEKFVLGLVEIP